MKYVNAYTTISSSEIKRKCRGANWLKYELVSKFVNSFKVQDQVLCKELVNQWCISCRMSVTYRLSAVPSCRLTPSPLSLPSPSSLPPSLAPSAALSQRQASRHASVSRIVFCPRRSSNKFHFLRHSKVDSTEKKSNEQIKQKNVTSNKL